MVNKIDKYKKKDLLDISTPKELLAALLITGGVISIAAISPALLAAAIPAAQLIKKEDKNKRRKIQKNISYLRSKKLISTSSNTGGAKIRLTKSGEKFVKKYYVSTHINAVAIPKKWDGRWRVILYDVPAGDRLKRDALRYFIKKLNMQQMQKSVWVYPFDCAEQVCFLKEFIELSDSEIRFIVTGSIGDDKKFKKIFNI